MSVTTIRTSLGPRLLPPARMVRLSLTRRELDTLLRTLDRHAIAAEREGRFEEADKLATRVAALRIEAHDTGRRLSRAAQCTPLPTIVARALFVL